MSCTLNTDWAHRGFQAVILENRYVRLTVLPEFGGKVIEFRNKKFDRDLLYHHPRVEVRAPVYGMQVDDWWSGGIDEFTPTLYACQYRGQPYPDFGELWALPWQFDVEKNGPQEVTIHLSRKTVAAPLKIERWMTLREGQSSIEMRHRITNQGYGDFQFIWGIHCGISISESSRIDIPASEVTIDYSLPNNRLGKHQDTYHWPFAGVPGKEVDMRNVPPPETQTVDMHYATKFSQGWLSVTDTVLRMGFGMVFPTEVFKAIGMWLVYGGYRNMYCLAIEPWTGYPGKLDEAVKTGEYSNLKAGESLEFKTLLIAHEGYAKINSITKNGNVEGV